MKPRHLRSQLGNTLAKLFSMLFSFQKTLSSLGYLGSCRIIHKRMGIQRVFNLKYQSTKPWNAKTLAQACLTKP